MRQVAPRRDPAPTRAQYRLQRLLLTPIYRKLIRVGLPVFLMTMAVGLYLSSEDRRNALTGGFAAMREKLEQRPEFMVGTLDVKGASPQLTETIKRYLALPLPQSSFSIDLEAVRQKIETLDAVARVDVRVQPGGVLQAVVTERVPALVWRSAANVELLDATGHRVTLVHDRADRNDLPLVAGRGANVAAPEALAIIAAAEPIMPRVRGLIRMGERRWDIVLDRNQRILLPVENPVAALERIIALDQAQDLLARDVIAIDLRLKDRPVLRLAPYAQAELRRARGMKLSGSAL
ncbi:cell division protein FtsQ/DivIB [Cereibacter sp. SYSU M97828]|nr:cell division protein FtsQ/DivIB [Cereibacter flavus]